MNNLEALAKELEEHVKRTAELQKKFEEASKAEEEFKFPIDGWIYQYDKKVELINRGICSINYYATKSLAEYYGKIIRKNMIIAQYVAQKAPDYRLEDIGLGEWFFFVTTDSSSKWFVNQYNIKRYIVPTEIYMPEHVAYQLVKDLNSGKLNLEEL